MVLDTNILIYYFHGEQKVVSYINNERSKGNQFAISVISVVELLSYPKITIEEVFHLERLINEFLVVPIDTSLARQAASFRKQYNFTVSDALVMATAQILKTNLVTRDKGLRKAVGIAVII